MKIVIDIPNEDIEAIKELQKQGYASRHEIAILNGTSFEDIKSRIKERADEEDIVNFAKGMLFALEMIDSEVE